MLDSTSEIIVSVSEKSDSESLPSITGNGWFSSNIYYIALEAIPSLFDPNIVYVFPVPVYPYANIVELMPCNTESTQGLIFSYTSFWVAFASKTWLNL